MKRGKLMGLGPRGPGLNSDRLDKCCHFPELQCPHMLIKEDHLVHLPPIIMAPKEVQSLWICCFIWQRGIKVTNKIKMFKIGKVSQII